MNQDIEVTYSGKVGDQGIKGEYSPVTGADLEVVAVCKGRGGRVLVTAGGMFVRVREFANDGQWNLLATYKPFEDGIWIPWLHT